MRRAVALGALTLLVIACSALVERDVVQCRSDDDCIRPEDPNFVDSSCADGVCKDPLYCAPGPVTIPDQDTDNPVSMRARFVNLGEKPVAGAKVLVCVGTEASCESYRGKTYETDADGYFYAEVPRYFAGHFYVKDPPPSPEFREGFLPTRLYPRRYPAKSEPPNLDIPEARSARLVTVGAIDAILALKGIPVTVDTTRAQIFGSVLDCNGRPLAGAIVKSTTIDPKTVPFYSASDGLPAATVFETTPPKAIFGFLNVPISETGAEFELSVTKGTIPWADLRVNLRPGELVVLGVRYEPPR